MQSTRDSTHADSIQEIGMTGTWDIEVTLRNCATGTTISTLRAVNLFASGGILTETGARVPPGMSAPGEGVWRYSGGQSYSAVVRFFHLDQHGVVTGIWKVTRQLELSRDGGQFTGTARTEMFDNNGKLIRVECATEVANRF